MFRVASDHFAAILHSTLRLTLPSTSVAAQQESCFAAATVYAEAVNQWSAAEDAAAIGTVIAPTLTKMLSCCVACGSSAAVAAAAVDDVTMRAAASDVFCAGCFSAAAHTLLSEASSHPVSQRHHRDASNDSDVDDGEAVPPHPATMAPAEAVALLADMVHAGELPHLFLHRVRSPARWIACDDGGDVRTFSIGVAGPPAGALAPASVLPQLLAMDAAPHALSGIAVVMPRGYDSAALGPQLEAAIACVRVASVLLLPPASDAERLATDDVENSTCRGAQWVTVIGVSEAVNKAFASVNGRAIALSHGPVTAPSSAAAGTVRGVLAHGLLKASGFLRSGVPPGGFEINSEIAVRLVVAADKD